MKRNREAWISLLLLLFSGCVPQKAPPKIATPDFSYTPPSTTSSKVDMTIALIRPDPKGFIFTGAILSHAEDMALVESYLSEMLNKTKTDMEAILVAKGFNTLGPFDTIDEMTYSQKERASLIYAPRFEVKMDFAGGDVTQGTMGTVSQQGTLVVRGNVSLAMLEPMTREKVWLKRIELDAFSAPYTVSVKTRKPQSGDLLVALLGGAQQPKNTQVEAAVAAMNNFYAKAMSKMWDHLDQREILQLRGETQKLKKLKRY